MTCSPQGNSEWSSWAGMLNGLRFIEKLKLDLFRTTLDQLPTLDLPLLYSLDLEVEADEVDVCEVIESFQTPNIRTLILRDIDLEEDSWSRWSSIVSALTLMLGSAQIGRVTRR